MIARRPESVTRVAGLSLAGVLLIVLGGTTSGQHTPDPYNIVGEYNSQYEPYMYADYPTTPGIQPNQARLEGQTGLRRANSFQKFLDSENDEPGDLGRPAMTRPAGPGTPYYRAYRRFDQEFQRTYRPNEAADRTYYNDQEKRNDKYFQALREPDPRKRAQLLRDYNLDNMRAARDLSSGRTPSERDREAPRDRFTPGGTSLYPESDVDELRPPRTTTPPARQPGGSVPSAPRPPGGLAPRPGGQPGGPAPAPRRSATGTGATPAPPPRGRTDGTAPRAPVAPSRTPGRSTAPPARRPADATGAAGLLNRSELMDRAIRATAPVVPRSSAPPTP